MELKMQEITLQISVKTNTSSSAEEIAAIIQRLIDIGLADASATAMSGEGDVDEAEKATDLNISAPVAVKMPRVLVVVSGGSLILSMTQVLMSKSSTGTTTTMKRIMQRRACPPTLPTLPSLSTCRLRLDHLRKTRKAKRTP